jgi:hypothetical protein
MQRGRDQDTAGAELDDPGVGSITSEVSGASDQLMLQSPGGRGKNVAGRVGVASIGMPTSTGENVRV